MTETVLYYTFIIMNLGLLGLQFKNDCWRGQKPLENCDFNFKEGFKFTKDWKGNKVSMFSVQISWNELTSV